VTVRLTPTVVGSELAAVKPREATVTRYVPGLICEKRKWPSAPVWPVRVAWVFTSVAVTVAFGRTPPVVSATVPAMALEVPLCACRMTDAISRAIDGRMRDIGVAFFIN
jgi:hypothetical protein